MPWIMLIDVLYKYISTDYEILKSSFTNMRMEKHLFASIS